MNNILVNRKILKLKNNSTNGFSLLEVMISMVIFAIGLLGLAAMQAISLENAQVSTSRGQAINFAYSMSDLMRANKDAKDSYLIAHGETVTNPSCVTNSCIVSQLAVYDQMNWKKNLADNLLSGDGQIAGADPEYTITVRWDEDHSGATGTNCPVLSSADLRCYQLKVRL
jgi:type IV pilus assembly protein PilV